MTGDKESLLIKKNQKVARNAQRAYRRIKTLRYGINKAIDELPLNPFDAIETLKKTLRYIPEGYKDDLPRKRY